MENQEKFWTAINILKSNVKCTVNGDIKTEEDFNNIIWQTGTESNGKTAKVTNTCPHSEITWTKLKAEMDKL
tara:strand:- start:27 stop:242 length:216 start_codon:yes stop_codon:yes gene_type:complete